MAKGDFYFPLYYQRLLTSTIGWKDDEFGAYVKLLIYQFDKGSIPSDINEIARISPTAKKNWAVLSKKFTDDGNGGLINTVMSEIRDDVNRKKEKNKENGKFGGRPKKNNQTGNPNETQLKPEGFENGTQTKAIPISNNQYPNKERDSPPPEYPIEECKSIALRDPRWIKANKASDQELTEFNSLLEKRGIYDKNPADYKSHFANWKLSGKKEENLPAANTNAMSLREKRAQEILKT